MSRKSVIAAGFVVLFSLIFGAVPIANFSGVKIVHSDINRSHLITAP
jgi:hypothetical protein